jgi:uncharacterized membrane protein YdjX (TVP38/TMEM64 family)/GNAT superfamily N-acetyltransferase
MSLLVFLSMILQALIPPIPAEILVIASALSIGVLKTTFFAGSGLLAGSLLCALAGRLCLSYFSKFFSPKQKHKFHGLLQRYGTLLLYVRILPYNPSDIISYVSGFLSVSPVRLVVITAITSYTRCFILAMLGASMSGKNTFFLIVALFAVCAILIKLMFSFPKGLVRSRVLYHPRIIGFILTNMCRLDPSVIILNSRVYALYSPDLKCFCTIKHWKGFVELGTVYTLRAYRKKGYMRSLLSHVLKGKKVFVLCGQDLEGFYEQFGFHRVQSAPRWLLLRVKWFNTLLSRMFGYKLLIMLRENHF